MIREYVYTIQEAADSLGVSRVTVSRWRKAGRIPGEDIGGVVLIPRWAVEAVRQEREAISQKRKRRARTGGAQ